jgi:hypothetical protein
MARADMAGKMGLHVAYGSNNESDERDESVDLDCLLPEAVCAVPRLRKLPPGPSRSLGGYLDYEGWPDRERFMELDRALQHAADEVLGKLFMELGPMTFAQRFEFRNVASTVQQAGCAPLADSPRAARPRPF